MHIENKDEKDNSDVFKSKLEILEDLEKKKSDDKTVIILMLYYLILYYIYIIYII